MFWLLYVVFCNLFVWEGVSAVTIAANVTINNPSQPAVLPASKGKPPIIFLEANATINNTSQPVLDRIPEFDAATFLVEENIEHHKKLTYKTIPIVLRDAFVISTKNYIPQNALNAAEQCGFTPRLFKAVVPRLKEFNTTKGLFKKCLPEVMRNQTVKEKIKKLSKFNRLTLGELALVCSHRRVLEQIATSQSSSNHDWSLVLEDDATIHPDTPDPKLFVRKAFEVMATIGSEYGFVYLGFKHGMAPNEKGCRKFLVTQKFEIRSEYHAMISADCNGHGTHAYAVTKQRAATLFSEAYSDDVLMMPPHFAQVDQVYDRNFKKMFDVDKTGFHNYVLGIDLISPLQNHIRGETHRGIIYQGNMTRRSRSTAGSALRGKNKFVDDTNEQFQKRKKQKAEKKKQKEMNMKEKEKEKEGKSLGIQE